MKIHFFTFVSNCVVLCFTAICCYHIVINTVKKFNQAKKHIANYTVNSLKTKPRSTSTL